MNFRDADTLEFGGKGDAAISRTGPDAFTFGNGTEQDATATINVRDLKEQAVSGATQFYSHQAELITLSLSQPTTDSVALLLPANAIIKAVCALVTKAIAGATSWALGDDSTAARFAGCEHNFGARHDGSGTSAVDRSRRLYPGRGRTCAHHLRRPAHCRPDPRRSLLRAVHASYFLIE